MAKTRKKKPILDHATAAAQQLSPLIYDPLEPQYSALHRAGMVGLALQIEAMKKQQQEPRPEMSWVEEGRAIKVVLDRSGLRALFQERYLGLEVIRERSVDDKKAESQAETPPRTETVPRLRYLEVFGAVDLEKRQSHLRDAYYQSFFQIPPERKRFFKAPSKEHALRWRNPAMDEDADKLWAALVESQAISIQKSTRPNIVKYDLKGVRILDRAKQALLLHFWPLASSFFTPEILRYDTKKKEVVDDRIAPVVLAPDVSHVRGFFDCLVNSYARDFPSPVINTSLEAVFAFYVAPRIAHGLAINEEVFSELQQSVRGASVFVYRRPLKRGKPDKTKQPEVRGVYDEAYSEEKLQAYIDLIRQDLKSPLYRGLRVKNLIDDCPWHSGFDRLVDEWRLELFVPVKNRKTNAYEMRPKGLQLASDLAADFKHFAAKEEEMDEAEARIPTLIDKLVEHYLNERVYGKGQTRFNRKEMTTIFQKEKDSRSPDEEKMRKALNEKHAKGVNQEFVDFRGATDQPRFTELFVTRLFDPSLNAPYTDPEERAMLRQFYENEWESARWLVLMAISAAGAPRERKSS